MPRNKHKPNRIETINSTKRKKRITVRVVLERDDEEDDTAADIDISSDYFSETDSTTTSNHVSKGSKTVRVQNAETIDNNKQCGLSPKIGQATNKNSYKTAKGKKNKDINNDVQYGLYPDEVPPEESPVYLLGLTSEAEFQVMSEEHMVVYFEKQDDDSLLCGLHALNNVTNCFSYKKDYLDQASRRLEQDIPENNNRQTQQLGDIAEGYYSSEVLKETVNKRYGRLTMQEMTPTCHE